MIKFIKTHKLVFGLIVFLLFVDSFVIAINFISSKKDVTAPGGLNEVRELIEVEGNNDIKGSFNTIYVYSYTRASILQTFVASLGEYNEIEDSSTTTLLSYQERVKAGHIQKNQSIQTSLICAYNYAKENDSSINIDWKLLGFAVSSRQIYQTNLEIGDLIYGVTHEGIYYDSSNPSLLSAALNSTTVGDTIHFVRDELELTYVISEEIKSSNYNSFYSYAQFEIDEKTIFPKFELNSSNTLGPSGGLMQTLSVYCQVSGVDLTNGKKICGTGTIGITGKVGAIGGISQKVVTAFRSGADVFICPKANSEEGYATYLKIKGHEKMTFIVVETFEEAVIKLGELYEA